MKLYLIKIFFKRGKWVNVIKKTNKMYITDTYPTRVNKNCIDVLSSDDYIISTSKEKGIELFIEYEKSQISKLKTWLQQHYDVLNELEENKMENLL